MSGRLRLVVFTAGSLVPANRVLFDRLASDPLINLTAVVVDTYARPSRSLVIRLSRGVQREGAGWLAFKFRSSVAAWVARAWTRVLECKHPPVAVEEDYDLWSSRTGVPVHRVDDIHDSASLSLIRSLRPDLGIIVGGRILRDELISIPERGTLNIHKRKVPDYRGGGPVGYWEVLAGEREIGVTIHYAVAAVDAGPVLAEAGIPVEVTDTLESLKIKADLVGIRLYHETIQRLARGKVEGVAQDLSRGRTYRAPGELAVWRLERQLRRRARRLRSQTPGVADRGRSTAPRGFPSPWRRGHRDRVAAGQRVPVALLFYRPVGPRLGDHMCLPLEEFVHWAARLRRYYPLLSLKEAAERLRLGRKGQVGTILAFADGPGANVWAVEYLRAFGIPACLFPPAGNYLDELGNRVTQRIAEAG